MKNYLLILIISVFVFRAITVVLNTLLIFFTKQKKECLIEDETFNGFKLILKVMTIFVFIAILIISMLYREVLSREPNDTGNIYSQYKRQQAQELLQELLNE